MDFLIELDTKSQKGVLRHMTKTLVKELGLKGGEGRGKIE